ncbi:uncharacterized protein [Eurosta solidaginis]|uniref:uncharacterized protein n=1 Tax=Eurosta solidaginis TaxID=178769 RepID=UPI003530D0A0
MLLDTKDYFVKYLVTLYFKKLKLSVFDISYSFKINLRIKKWKKFQHRKKKVRVSKAQQNKNYIAKLKGTGKFEEYKKKRAASTKLYRRKKKNEENEMPQTTISSVLEKRRENIRQRVQKFREKMRTGEKRSRSVLSDTQLTGYNCSHTFGKAVRKAERTLPQSPTKRKAVLTKIFSNVREANKMDMETSILPPPPQKKIHQNILMLKKAIIAFYERDDISRVSPRIRDVKEYLSESGEKILLPTRHMVLSCREACALFNEEQGNSGKDTCGITFFPRHRPDHVKLIKELPHNMCLCSYHANFIDAVSALHKFVAHVSDYENGFVLQFLCDIPSMGCWYGECVKCTGITVPKLTALVGEADLDMQVSWMKWTKNDGVNRTERRQKSGKLTDLVAYISGLSAQFLIHSFNKCEQSEVFNVHDRPRALSVNYAKIKMKSKVHTGIKGSFQFLSVAYIITKPSLPRCWYQTICHIQNTLLFHTCIYCLKICQVQLQF